jgi:hypothetical protein
LFHTGAMAIDRSSGGLVEHPHGTAIAVCA